MRDVKHASTVVTLSSTSSKRTLASKIAGLLDLRTHRSAVQAAASFAFFMYDRDLVEFYWCALYVIWCEN